MAAPVRLAVVLDSFEQPEWVADVIRQVRASSFAKIIAVVLGQPGTSPHKPLTLAGKLYSRFDAALFRGASASTRLADRRALLEGCPILETTDASLPDLDVVLQFGASSVSGVKPRFGVWRLRAGDGAAEFAAQQETSSAALEVDGVVVARAVSGTDPLSLARGRTRLLRKATAMIVSELARLHRSGSIAPRVEEAPPAAENACPRMWRALRGAAVRYVHHQLRRKAMRQQWLLAFRFAPPESDAANDFANFHRIVPPRDRLWADPFVVADGDRAWLFLEELVYAEGRGVIAVAEIRRDGSWTTPRRILERPYHLSYPCIFRWNGDWYMLPETGENGTIELYRASQFPDIWEPAAVLMRGMHAVDATIFEAEGHWWMYLSTSADGDNFDDLSLYFAPSPLGPWSPHPLNPVVRDATAGRCAGKPYRVGGRLLRAAQNGARRYGHAMKVREIVTLTPTEYEERDVSRIEPRWMGGLVGTHTLNRDGDVTVIDGVRYLWGAARSFGKNRASGASGVTP